MQEKNRKFRILISKLVKVNVDEFMHIFYAYNLYNCYIYINCGRIYTLQINWFYEIICLTTLSYFRLITMSNL